MMSAFAAILLGVLRGVTVFLPLSYSGHTALLSGLFGLNTETDALYALLLNISTLLSVVIAYGPRLRKMGVETMLYVTGRFENPLGEGRMPTNVRAVCFLLSALIPTLVLLPLRCFAVSLSENLWFVCFALIVQGLLIFAADRFVKPGEKRDRTCSLLDVLLVGLGFALGAVPGLSPLGLGLIIGLTRGFHREFAVRFAAMLTLIPGLIGVLSAILRLFRGGAAWGSLPWYLIGAALSAFLGAICIGATTRILARKRFRRAAWYLWLVGGAALIAAIF